MAIDRSNIDDLLTMVDELPYAAFEGSDLEDSLFFISFTSAFRENQVAAKQARKLVEDYWTATIDKQL